MPFLHLITVKHLLTSSLTIGITVLLIQCKADTTGSRSNAYYGNDIGDIRYEEGIDDSNFEICDPENISTRRSGLQYAGGQEELINKCHAAFQNISAYKSYTGYITLRFTVNCYRDIDRFRIASLDNYFSRQDCPDQLQKDILSLGRSLGAWESRAKRDEGIDFSKFLNFNFENGQFITVIQ